MNQSIQNNVPNTMTPGPMKTFQQNQQVINPADGKPYQVQQQTPGKGMTLIDPSTNQTVMVAEQDVQNLQPAVRTSSEKMLLERMVDDLIEQKSRIAQRKKENIIERKISIEGLAREIIAEMLGEELPMSSIAYNKRMRASEMRKKWDDTRKLLKTRSQLNEQERRSSPTYNEPRQEQAIRELGLGKVAKYDPYEGDLNEEVGRDNKTGLPMRGGKDVEVGLTEFPYGVDKTKNPEGYGKMTMEEMDNKFEEEHDHFKNEQLLPDYTKKREESDTYLNRDDRRKKIKDLRKDFHNPRYAPDGSTGVGTTKEATMESVLDNMIGVSKTAEESLEGEITKLPIQYKDVKKAPGKEMGFVEPQVLETANPDVKAAVEMLKNTQSDVENLKAQIAEKSKPLQDAIMDATKELNTQLAEKAALIKTCLDMLHDELNKTTDKVAVIEDEIYAAIDREKAVAPAASLPQILAKAKEVNPQLIEEINKIKATIESDNTRLVLEQFLYKYPVSEVQKKKISSSSDINTLVQEIVGLINDLTVLNESL